MLNAETPKYQKTPKSKYPTIGYIPFSRRFGVWGGVLGSRGMVVRMDVVWTASEAAGKQSEIELLW